ncbi:Conserved oligomeric Golgi complex subunit 2 [Orbilia oligospora]|uniref:Conserved oligomeric Golgi complex subunit 2 n=1 Tax=Orbilia oligospora TaxID=2813651 RepID=A0A7C8JRI5_ORBOL|nr:Conserved oligomeric Golgi complex subunit 2 [Orbilia oligospora]
MTARSKPTLLLATSTSDSDPEDDFSSLPFPQPLPRSAFITTDFSASSYLASLHRHQTLEDLRAELRTRSKDLERELVELVNRDYADFVGLGSSLRGGEGKVNDLKLGVMGFAREIEGVKEKVVKVSNEMEKDMALARNLLTFDSRLSQLESLLLLKGQHEADDHILTLDLDETSNSSLTSLPRLQKLVTSYLYLKHVLSKIPPTHPFVKAQGKRLKQAKQTLSDDLSRALKECRAELKGEGQGENERKELEGRLVEILKLWSEVGEARDAVKSLKGRK